MRISDWSSDVCSSDLHLWLLGGHDRLIVQLELVFGERFPKGPFHVEPVIDLLLQIEVEMPVNSPAVALCMIKREISSLEQFFDRAAVAWPHRSADAASDVELALVAQIHLRQHVDEALRNDQIGSSHVCTPVTTAHLVS